MGKTKHKRKNTIFKNSTFKYDAYFNKSTFTTADFHKTYFGGIADFSETEFKDKTKIYIKTSKEKTYVDFTDTSIKIGTFIQLEDTWVHYDLTNGSIGDISFVIKKGKKEVDKDVLDYFRFCNTELDEFDGYDFSFVKHMEYFDRNNYNLHGFNLTKKEQEKQGIKFKMYMTPENIERTYLKAKTASSNTGQTKAAQEFRIKRQRYARKKRNNIIKDKNQEITTRINNLSRSLENLFMD